MMSTAKRIWTTGFYWIGVAMTLACFAFILAGNTDLVWRFEHAGFPLSWAFAGVAVLAFLGAEFSQSASSRPGGAEDLSSQLSPELAAAESEN
jgi:hypothetical protein